MQIKVQVAFFTLLFGFLGSQAYAVATEWHPDMVAPITLQEDAPCLTQRQHQEKYPRIEGEHLVSAMLEKCAR